MALLVLAFYMGRLLRFMFSLGSRATEKAPGERCALCAEDGILRTYPCLVKLATGQVGQIRVGAAGGYTCFFFAADCFASAEGSTTSLTLPEKQQQIDPALFCRDCRAKLAEVTMTGYVLADLYDHENIQLYPITDGAEYDIRGYTVEITKEKDGLTVEVMGYFD